MSIQSSELLWRNAALTSDTTPAQNGGRMGSGVMTDNAANNLFPNVTQAQREAGLVTLRKDFLHVASAEDATLSSVRIYIDAQTAAADWITFSPGSQTDTAATHVAVDTFGSGKLHTSTTSGATALSITPENIAAYTALQPFKAGYLVRISDAPYSTDAAPTSYATITDAVYAADRINLTVTPALSADHAVGTHVAAVYQSADIAASATTPAVISTAGLCSAVKAHNKGSIEQIFTLTFTSATDFSVSGDTLGAFAIGTTTSTTAPVNPATSSAYFTLESTAFSGTFAPGDTVSFTTHPAAVPLWWRREVPANSASLAGNVLSRAVTGESA